MPRLHWLGLAVIHALLLSACRIDQPVPVQPGRAISIYPSQQQTQTLFTNVATEAGVRLVHRGNAPVMPLGGGVAFGDVDNDGWRDLYVVNFGANMLFHNNGDGTFTDVTDSAGVGARLWWPISTTMAIRTSLWSTWPRLTVSM